MTDQPKTPDSEKYGAAEFVRVTALLHGHTRKTSFWAKVTARRPGVVVYRKYTKQGDMLNEIIIGVPSECEEQPARLTKKYCELEII